MKSILRIGIDGHMLGDKSGGNESFYTNYLNYLHPSKDMEVFLFVKEGVDVTQYEDKFKIVRFKSKSAFFRNYYELNKLCEKYNIDVLHTQYFIPFFCKCKIMCTIHDICFEHFNNIFTLYELLRQKILISYSAKKANRIHTISEYSRNDIISTYRINPNKIFVACGGPNERFRIVNLSDNEKDYIRKKYGICSSRFLLTVGNLQPRKNLRRLIEAYSKCIALFNEEIQLVIVGKKAWLYDKILEDAKGYESKIILTDYVSDDDLVKLYNMAELFIYPSIFEGFGYPPFEALACGTKVVVSNRSSIPEVIGDLGVYFNPFDVNDIADKIMEALEQGKGSDFYEKVQSLINKYNWNDAAESIRDNYILTMNMP